MNLRRFFLEAVTIAALAVAIALVSNAFSSRDKKLNLVGDYPNATTVPSRSLAPIPDRVAAPDSPPSDATTTGATPESAVKTSASDTSHTTSASGASRKVRTPPRTPSAEPSSSKNTPATKPATETNTPPDTPAHHATRAEILRRFPPTPDTQFQEISGDDAAWLHANGVLFLDARRTSVYEHGHIAGARSFPVWESDITNRIGALLNEVTDQDMPIVVYCSGGECEDSHMLAQKLWGVFYSNVLVYKDGFPDWQKRGGAIDTGDTP